ncbi:MAG: enoyl-CoA hydratase/isomerase family protein [Gemmatimonadetes bacterium]|nr:enoyl-CoA hydratase/isomerase family protein [Gemmatimonadota bacterium]
MNPLTDVVLLERRGPIATVVLNRPERLNALNQATWTSLTTAFGSLDRDDSVRCIVVRGAGDRAFAAGADIAEFAAERSTVEQAREYGAVEHRAVMAVADCRHPTVALIRGACVGGGLEIAVACDIRICGISGRFGVPINRLGLTMQYPELEFFIRAIGRAAALEILLEGSVVDAERALALGLVNRVVPDDHVEREAYASAERIAEGAPLVNRWHKRFVRRLDRGGSLTPEELDEAFEAYATDDYRIGYQAFLGKQQPRFEGK